MWYNIDKLPDYLTGNKEVEISKGGVHYDNEKNWF